MARVHDPEEGVYSRELRAKRPHHEEGLDVVVPSDLK